MTAFPRVREALTSPPTRIPRSAWFNRRWTRYGDRGLPGCAGKRGNASSEERAHRRMLQLRENGFSVSFERLWIGNATTSRRNRA